MQTQEAQKAGIAKLRELMTDIKFCMLTTFSSGANLHSRPMTLQTTEFDGDFWFFAGKNTELAGEIAKNNKAQVTFSKPEDMTFISVAGTAQFVEDKTMKRELWHSMYEVWFPQGVNDPNLLLLKINVGNR